MAGTDATIIGLTAIGNLGSILVTATASAPLGMTCLPYMQPASVNFYVSSTNDYSIAIFLKNIMINLSNAILIHGDLPDGATRYYWARALDSDGNLGDPFPSDTAGASATTKTSSSVPPPNSITEDMLQDGIISKEKFIPGITPIEIVTALPTTDNYAGRMVYYLGKLYRHTGSPAGSAGFTAAVPAVDITGQITHTQINTPNLAAISANLGTVTAGTLTAATSYLGAVSAAQLSVSSLSAINANLGNITAGTITGVTYTGGTFRTATSGRRIEITGSNNRFTAYNPSNTPIVIINDTGAYPGILNSIGWESEVRAAHFNSNTTAGTESAAVFISRAGTANAPGLDVSANNRGSHSHSVRFFNAGTAGQGALGVSVASGGYAFISTRGGYGPFTGAHDAFILKGELSEPGDIVIDGEVLYRHGVSDTVTRILLTDIPSDKRVAGVIATRVPFDPDSILPALPFPDERQEEDPPSAERLALAAIYDRVTMNGVGEGQVNVCGLGGDIEAGDYIVTSSIKGKGQKQSDDIKRSCTVARARESVTFDYPTQVKTIACFYECG